MKVDPKSISIEEAHKAMKNGEFTATDLLESCLDNIKKDDGEIHAFLEVFEDTARKEAREAEERFEKGDAGLLTGIPISIKDNILIEGKICSASSKILENYKAIYDATVIKKLKKAGAVFVGRTNLDEFAMGASTENSAFGPTKNPHDTSRVPGGSSGGSAASVAAGMCLVSLGSDTAGSIRQPASFCGVTGLKPTYGGVSRYGLIALGSSLDVIGPITKSTRDTEIVFEVIKGDDSLDSTAPTFEEDSSKFNKKIGIPDMDSWKNTLDKDVIEVFNQAVEKFKDAGYEIVDLKMPNLKYAVPAYYVILPAEASSNLARYDGVKYGMKKEGNNLLEDYLLTRGEGFGKEVRRRILIGTYALSAGYYDAYYNKAVKVRDLIASDYEKAFQQVSLVLTPTTAGPAFKLGEKSNDPVKMYLEDIFTVPANHAGIPAISIPSGSVEREGQQLPLGFQLIAPHHKEDWLFRAGEDFSNKK